MDVNSDLQEEIEEVEEQTINTELTVLIHGTVSIFSLKILIELMMDKTQDNATLHSKLKHTKMFVEGVCTLMAQLFSEYIEGKVQTEEFIDEMKTLGVRILPTLKELRTYVPSELLEQESVTEDVATNELVKLTAMFIPESKVREKLKEIQEEKDSFMDKHKLLNEVLAAVKTGNREYTIEELRALVSKVEIFADQSTEELDMEGRITLEAMCIYLLYENKLYLEKHPNSSSIVLAFVNGLKQVNAYIRDNAAVVGEEATKKRIHNYFKHVYDNRDAINGAGFVFLL